MVHARNSRYHILLLPSELKILEFPKHLQETITVLLKMGRGTAEDVGAETGRARAVESCYLNQLCLWKVARSERVGRKVFFTVNVEELRYER